MKKRFLLVLTTLFACATIHAQFAQMSLLTPHYYPGEVYFKDGHVEEFAELELPRVGKSKLGAKKNAEDKGHIDIEAADIIGIKIWHKNFPDKKHVLYYVHINGAIPLWAARGESFSNASRTTRWIRKPVTLIS